MRRALFLVTLLLAPTLAGCAGLGETAPAAQGDGDDSDAPEHRTEERSSTATFRGVVTGAAGRTFAPMGAEGRNLFRFDVPANVTGLTLRLAWQNPQADLDLAVRAPDGTVHRDDGGEPGSGDTPVELVLERGLVPGVWRADVTGKSAVEETFDLDVDVRYEVRVPLVADAPADAGARGDVQIEPTGNGYRASLELTYRTDLAGVENVQWDASTVNGHVQGAPADGTEAQLTATLYAVGETEEEARERLDGLDVTYEAILDGEDATVRAEAVARDGASWSNRGIHFDAQLPSSKRYALEADTSNGAVAFRGLTGASAVLDTSNAAIVLEDLLMDALEADTSNGAIEVSGVEASTAVLSTSNAGIRGDLVADDASVDTSNAGITLDLAARGRGTWEVSSSNAGITLTVPEDPRRGYDLLAETSSHQRVTVDLQDVERVEDEEHRKHVRTHGYDERDVRVEAQVHTSNANVAVRTR